MCTKLLSVLVQTPEPAPETEPVVMPSSSRPSLVLRARLPLQIPTDCDNAPIADVVTFIADSPLSVLPPSVQMYAGENVESLVSGALRVCCSASCVSILQLESPLNGVSAASLGDASMLDSADYSWQPEDRADKLADDNSKLKVRPLVVRSLTHRSRRVVRSKSPL